jgi:DNA polymerase I-like protein with 3'-5' exonuclease and polymerase domains
MLASQVIDNGYHDSANMVGNIPNYPSPHSLIGVVRRYLGVDLDSKESKKTIRLSFIGMNPEDEVTEDQVNYAASDVDHLFPLRDAQLKYIEERKLSNVIKLENTLTPVLVKVEFNGCLIDKEKHKQNIKDWKIKRNEIESKLDSIVCQLSRDYPRLQGGKYTNKRVKESYVQLDAFGGAGYVIENLNKNNVNYSSSQQIEDLFNRVGCSKPTDDFGKVSFGENCLKTYVNNNPNSPLSEFVTILLEYREYSKLLSTYGQKLFDVLDSNGRLRTSYSQCFTDTGRLASSEVLKERVGANLANIPKRADIRSIFIPDPGYSFVDSDMSGQEVLIAGDFSKEPVILKAFKEGFDHHSFLASISYSIIFKKQIEIKNKSEDFEIEGFKYNHKKLRDVHKSCLFAKFYGGGKMRVMNVLNEYLVNHWPPELRLEKADEISKALNKALPVLTTHLKKQINDCYEKGYSVANKLGRRRYFDNPKDSYGEISNFGIQGTGADSIKIALIKLDKWLMETAKNLNIEETELGFIVMSIYDQNLLCINDKYLYLAQEIPRIMSESINYFLEDLIGSSDLQIKKHWSK